MHDTACSGLVHWDDPEVIPNPNPNPNFWYEEGGGREVQDGEHM